MRRSHAALAILGLILAACGSSKTDRAISGGGIGAAAGAGTSAVTGGNPVTGGLIGGAAGAGAGVLTDEDDVNLGDPIWNRDDDGGSSDDDGDDNDDRDDDDNDDDNDDDSLF
jgi:osmotically inducible lipoprotein OsmB